MDKQRWLVMQISRDEKEKKNTEKMTNIRMNPVTIVSLQFSSKRFA